MQLYTPYVCLRVRVPTSQSSYTLYYIIRLSHSLSLSSGSRVFPAAGDRLSRSSELTKQCYLPPVPTRESTGVGRENGRTMVISLFN